MIELIAMMIGLVAILVAVILSLRALRKICPDCGRRSLAFDGVDVGTKPRVYKCYACVRCFKAFATQDGRTFVAKDAWMDGQRDAAPLAEVVRE